MPGKKKSNTEIVTKYLQKFTGLSHLQIAKKIYADHPHLFKDVEQVRTRLRYYTGSQGNYNRKNIKPEEMIEAKQNDDVMKRWGLKKGDGKQPSAYRIPSNFNKHLWISDIHIPFHDERALTTALEYGLKHGANSIILGGDVLDNTSFTRHPAPPTMKKARQHFEDTKTFLVALRENFKDANIIWLTGNHDAWMERYLMDNCAVLFDDPYFKLEQRLGLEEVNIKYLPENQIAMIGKLPAIHGHQIMRGIFAPVNAARGAFLKTGHSIIIGHTHKKSEHNAKDIMGKHIKCISVGCLCNLRMIYDPFNNQNSHGFAFIETEPDGQYTVDNFEIINGKVRR